ncbi:MAG: chemotaxis protein MotB [Alphaproteobacteria bacterium]|nr:MAG: chemotaxis protein MotB [Alphaproteobacteria bacterium]
MSAQANAPIIKKVKKVSGGGHHGGAWKVAYADFVTAMMAFFMLMWLLNATTEKQRKGIADYFSPTVPIMRASGGGDGAFGGDSIFADQTLVQTGTGGVPSQVIDQQPDSSDQADQETKALEEVDKQLSAKSGESMVSELLQRYIVTRLTDEGLVIELHDLPDESLFVADTAEPQPVLEELVRMIAEASKLVRNGIAVEGYVAAQPVVRARQTVWDLSAERASRVRALLEGAGVPPERLKRVTGHADREPAAQNTMAPENNRIKIVLLRENR